MNSAQGAVAPALVPPGRARVAPLVLPRRRRPSCPRNAQRHQRTRNGEEQERTRQRQELEEAPRTKAPAVVHRVRDEPNTFGFRYDTLQGHLERGVEWFLLTRNDRGEIRFRIEARWQTGQFPNWWSRIGFGVLSGYYQRKWHRRAHHRLSLLAHYGSIRRPRRDSAGLTHQGIDVTFTYHTKRKWFQ